MLNKILLLITTLFILISCKKNVEESIIPETFLDRDVKTLGDFYVESNHIFISVWDHGKIDGDTISLFINGNIVIDEFVISEPTKPIIVDYKLDNQGYNYLLLYAHNLGYVSPNTCSILINDGISDKEFTMSSNLNQNGAVNIILMN